MRVCVRIALVAALVAHNDFWWWSDSSAWFGLPVGLTYHVFYCVAIALLLAALVLTDAREPAADP